MKRSQKIAAALSLACLLILVSCRSLDNGGGKDWVTIDIKVDRPVSSTGGNLAVSPSSTQTALITLIPATGSTVTSSTDLSDFYDRQLQNLSTGIVTLSAPLNESLVVVKETFDDELSLAQAAASEAATAFGASDELTITGSETSKTVTISLTTSGITDWTFVDGNGASGVNKDATRSGVGSHMAVYDSTLNGGPPSPTLFVAWSEESASNTLLDGYGQIRVAGWDGSSSWTFVDGDGQDGLNYDVNKEAEHVNLLAFDSKLYLAFCEYNISAKRQLRVTSWDGVGWESRDGDTSDGLNVNTSEDARDPHMVEFDSTLFLAWVEQYSSVNQIRVKKWVEASNWSWVESGDPIGINKDWGQNAVGVRLVVFNSKLYAVWQEKTTETDNPYQIRVAEWDGSTTWIFKDGDASTGKNRDTTKHAEEPMPLVFNSKLYIVWVERNSSDIGQIRVIEWDGASSWTFVDGDGANGLNKDVTQRAVAPTLFEYNSKLHATWSESNASGIFQIRVAQWDGTSSWAFVDGDEDDGLNKDTSHHAIIPRVIQFESELFLTFMEGAHMIDADRNTPDQIRVMVAPTGL